MRTDGPEPPFRAGDVGPAARSRAGGPLEGSEWILDRRMIAAEALAIGTVAVAVGLTWYLLARSITTATPSPPDLAELQIGVIALLVVALVGELLTGSPNLGVRRSGGGIDTRNILGQVVHLAPTPDGFVGWYGRRRVGLWSSGRLERPAYRVAVSRRQLDRLGLDASTGHAGSRM